MNLNSVPLGLKILAIFLAYIVFAVWVDSRNYQYSLLSSEALIPFGVYSGIFIFISGVIFGGLYLYRRFGKDKSATNGKMFEKAVIASFVLLILLLLVMW